MRVSALLFASLLVVGCGDDSTSATSSDMSVVAGDMSGGPTCAAYCAKIATTCTAGNGDGGDHSQYASTSACMSYCTTNAGWPAGTANATSGNTIACRLYHAGAAASDPTTHCPHAGPSGGDVCGSWCENYCQLMAKNCTGANAVYDAATCMTKCATIPTNGQPNDTTGNTVQCRIYHLGVAGTDAASATLHCPHSKTAADLTGGPCT
jgi:hypothetical protein